MNKEITIYELLGLIKEGKEPKRIKVDDVIYFYNSTKKDYKSEIDEPFFLFNDYVDIKSELDKIVEILEEDEDENITPLVTFNDVSFYSWIYVDENRRKINELIKEVNKLRKENNNG